MANYFDRDRDFDRSERDRDYRRGYAGNVYGREYDRDYDEDDRERRFQGGRSYDRDYDRGFEREDRGFWDRAGDRVRSWFGEEDIGRRRERDEWYDRPRGRRDFREEYSSDYDRGFGQGYGSFGREDERRGGRFDQGYERSRSATRNDFWMTHGPHSGVGPKGYQRSSDRMKEDVSERLSHHGHIDASDIEVSVENDIITLKGTVDSRRTKRLAEDIAESVPGVRDVHNQLHIRSEESGWQGRTSQTSQTSQTELGRQTKSTGMSQNT